MSALSQRLADAKGERSIDDVKRQAEREGHQIDRSVIAKYVSGDHGPRPPEKTLAALAAGLGLDVRELRELAGRPAGEREPYVPTPESASLTREQRQALDRLIKTMVPVQEGGQHGAGNTPTKKTAASRRQASPLRVVDPEGVDRTDPLAGQDLTEGVPEALAARGEEHPMNRDQEDGSPGGHDR